MTSSGVSFSDLSALLLGRLTVLPVTRRLIIIKCVAGRTLIRCVDKVTLYLVVLVQYSYCPPGAVMSAVLLSRHL